MLLALAPIGLACARESDVRTSVWGGAHHSWLGDPERRPSVVALTDTAVEGTSGYFPTAIRDAVYAASKAPEPKNR